MCSGSGIGRQDIGPRLRHGRRSDAVEIDDSGENDGPARLVANQLQALPGPRRSSTLCAARPTVGRHLGLPWRHGSSVVPLDPSSNPPDAQYDWLVTPWVAEHGWQRHDEIVSLGVV